MLDDAKAARMEAVVAEYWPESIDPAQVGSDALAEAVRTARAKLLETLDITELA